MNANLLSTSKITGRSVTNAKGEDLGDVKDVVVDVESGNVAYAVISFGGFLGIGDKYFAVPWDALKIEGYDDKVLMDVDKKTLENAPGFDKDEWPSSPDRGFVSQVHEHYGYKPYWEKQEEEEDIFITEIPGNVRKIGNTEGSSVKSGAEVHEQTLRDIEEQNSAANRPYDDIPPNSEYVGGYEKEKDKNRYDK